MLAALLLSLAARTAVGQGDAASVAAAPSPGALADAATDKIGADRGVALDATSERFAELGADTVMSAITVDNVWQRYYRLAPGKGLVVKLDGPTTLQFNVRIEGGPPPEPLMVGVERNGKLLRLHGLQPPPDDADVWSDRGLPVTAASKVVVHVPEGRHVVTLNWPNEADGDALLALQGAAAQNLKGSEVAGMEPEPEIRRITAYDGRTDDKGRAAGVTPVPPPPSKYRIAVYGGAGRSDESQTAPASLTELGVRAGYQLEPRIALLGRMDLRFSEQGYIARNQDLDGGLARANVEESRYDFALGAGYDFVPLLKDAGVTLPGVLAEGRLTAVPVGGLRWVSISNGAFPEDVLGLELGLRSEFALSPAATLRGGFGWTVNFLMATDSLSALGTPLWLLDADLAVGFPVVGGYTLELGLRWEMLALDFDARLSSGLVIGFGAAF